jgi:carotenoid cleavage dioxygenase-like enzyme
MPSTTDRSNPPPLDADLDVCGAVPPGLSGRLVALDPDGVIHSVLIGDGRASYSGRRLRTETVVHDLVYFGGSTLVFGDDSSAYELGPAGDTLRRVDLAGHRRSLAAPPTHDAATGELHLIAHDTNGLQAYVVVSAGALMRRSRPLLHAPEPIHDLVISRDHAILVADGFVGVVSRNGELRSTWIPTGTEAAHPVHAHDAGTSVIVLALTPLLERWTLHLETGTIQREVLDPTPRRFAQCSIHGADGTPLCLWTTGNGTIGYHDLLNSRHLHHSLHPGVPGDFVFVTDATPQRDADDGWLVGFVHHRSDEGTELFVIDAADIAAPAIVTAPIPRLVPPQLRCTWIPSTRQ